MKGKKNCNTCFGRGFVMVLEGDQKKKKHCHCVLRTIRRHKNKSIYTGSGKR